MIEREGKKRSFRALVICDGYSLIITKFYTHLLLSPLPQAHYIYR